MNGFISICFFLSRFFLMFLQTATCGNVNSIFSQEVKPPDGNYSVTFSTLKTQEKLRLYYSVSFKNKPIIEKSELGIVLDNHVSELAMAIKTDAD